MFRILSIGVANGHFNGRFNSKYNKLVDYKQSARIDCCSRDYLCVAVVFI